MLGVCNIRVIPQNERAMRPCGKPAKRVLPDDRIVCEQHYSKLKDRRP